MLVPLLVIPNYAQVLLVFQNSANFLSILSSTKNGQNSKKGQFY